MKKILLFAIAFAVMPLSAFSQFGCNNPDLIAPSPVCTGDISASVLAGGTNRIEIADIDEGSFDNCGNITMSISRDNPTPDDTPEMVFFSCKDNLFDVTLTITDDAGNSSQCYTTIKVRPVDINPPSLVCPSPSVIELIDLDGDGQESIDPADLVAQYGFQASDECYFTMDIIPSQFSAPFNFGVEVRATDGAGNVTTCPVIVLLKSCGSSSCNGNFTLNTQADVDNFNCGGVFNGNLTIDGSDITDLSPLCGITEITGALIIRNTSLVNLKGLNNLQSVGGEFSVLNNSSLINFDGLSSLQSIGDNFWVLGNASLINFNGLNSLQSVLERFIVENNSSLINFDGLSSLQSVSDWFKVQSNVSLISFDGLSSLQSIGDNFLVLNNASLINFNGLNSLQSVWDRFMVRNNASLINFDGLSNLQTVGGQLYVRNNASLINFNGLSSLQSVGGQLHVRNNTSLINFDGLSSLQTVGGQLYVLVNSSLINFDGLSSLQSVGGWFKVQSNSSLISFDGLSTLQSVGGGLVVFSNNSLTNLQGLENLLDAFRVTLTFNSTLNDCCGIYPLLLNNPNMLTSIHHNGGSACNDDQDILTSCGPMLMAPDNTGTIEAAFFLKIPVEELITPSEYGPVTEREDIAVYPNPTKGELYLEFQDGLVQASNVRIFDSLGKEVYSMKLPPNEVKISLNLTTLPAGVYFLQLGTSEQKPIVKRFILN